ncbi:MAG: hypothetical protein COA58_11515 [Bacteroidetes bacterium]|nr:MAG: hypothetical protein COA58_11515 [Bacteroidota bacterium]
MIITILSLVLFVTFTILGGFHFYWLSGNTWGLKKVIPTKTNELNTLEIPKFATLLVALALTTFGLLYLLKSGLIHIQIPNWVTDYAYWIIPSIFILRAIGDFKYLGFFKKIKNTEFGKTDSKLFSPLCLGIGVIGILIQLLK